jgi:hypothetical protein
MDAVEDEPRRLTTTMRVVLVIFLALAGLAFILLYLRSGHTAREFAWTIKPEITAAFLGAGYGAGCVLVAASLRRRPWAEVRVGIAIVLVFSTMILVATLLHLERFHFGAASGGIARLAAWVSWPCTCSYPPSAPGCSCESNGWPGPRRRAAWPCPAGSRSRSARRACSWSPSGRRCSWPLAVRLRLAVGADLADRAGGGELAGADRPG